MRRIQEYILAGDAFQVVYSQRFEAPRGGVDPFDVYRALRVINPSPYMFHLEFPEAIVTGASPEMLVRLEGGRDRAAPIAGTRRRGATPEEDAALERRAAAPIPRSGPSTSCWSTWAATTSAACRPRARSQVSELMSIERYSHVMHIVSNIRGRAARRACGRAT